MLVLGLRAPLAVLAAFAAVSGLTLSLAETLWTTSLQQRVGDELLARVSAYDWLGSTAGRPLGLALAGVLVSLAGPETVLLVASAGFAVVAVAATFSIARSVALEPID